MSTSLLKKFNKMASAFCERDRNSILGLGLTWFTNYLISPVSAKNQEYFSFQVVNNSLMFIQPQKGIDDKLYAKVN